MVGTAGIEPATPAMSTHLEWFSSLSIQQLIKFLKPDSLN